MLPAGETSGGGGDEIHATYSRPLPAPPPLPPPPPPRPVKFVTKVGRVPEFLIDMFITQKVNDLRKNWLDQVDEVEVRSRNMSSIMEKKFESLEIALHIEECPPKIQRVPPIILNDDNRKYFRPRMVSIGPFHHKSRPDLEVTEKMKLKLAALFLEEHRLQKKVVYFRIWKVIKDLKKYYEEEIKFDDDDLAWIFFVDGCAILHYIYCARNKNATSFIRSNIKVDCLTFMQEDLFLLENQLPFRVLELLMRGTDKENEMRDSIEKFIIDIKKAPKEEQEQEEEEGQEQEEEQGQEQGQGQEQEQGQGQEQEQEQERERERERELEQEREIERPVHLLDLLRTRLLQSVEEDEPYSIVQKIKKSLEFIKQPCERLRDLIECIGKACEDPSPVQTQDLQHFRCTEELTAAGIRLRPSNTGRLTDITFNLGTLKLPPIVVDGSTASKFLNLVAYEMCPDFVNDFGVSSYILFLDALIDRSQDVKVLRDKQILYNALGSDEEVAELFNMMGTNLVSNPEKYSNVKSDIQRRYCNRWMTWIAQFLHRHFQSPWSIIVSIAAIIVLALTVCATIYTVLEYYK